MTGSVGSASLLLALLVAMAGMVAPIWWGRTGRDRFFRLTVGAVLAQFALVTLAGLALVYALVATEDRDGRVGERYGIQWLPTTFLIGPDERLIARAIGPKDWAGVEARAVIRKLLQGRGTKQ